MQKALLCFLLLVISMGAYCQRNSNTIDSLLAITQRYYGANDKLFYGRLYRVSERGADGHPFLFSQSFQPATLYIKGNTFDSIPSRIDLENKLFIAKLEHNERKIDVLISDEALDSFLFSDRLFVNGKLLHPNLRFYYQSLYSSDLTLIRSFEKDFIAIYNAAHPKGKYGQLKEQLLLIKQDKVLDISSKQKIKKAIPEQSANIKTWLKAENTLYKKLNDDQLIRLIKECENNEGVQ